MTPPSGWIGLTKYDPIADIQTKTIYINIDHIVALEPEEVLVGDKVRLLTLVNLDSDDDDASFYVLEGMDDILIEIMKSKGRKS